MKRRRISYGILVISLSGILLSVWLLLIQKSSSIVDYFFIIFLGIVFLIALVIVIDRSNWKAVKIGAVLSGVILLLILVNTGIFKSATVLEAYLEDDLSGLRLYLRENGKFEMVPSFLVGEETFSGRYQIEGNKIHFLDPAYDNDFIPPTVTIWQDKIILTYDTTGQPEVGFAQYFKIEKNQIKNAP